MEVLFITRKWPPAVGGMETYCAELCRRLEGPVRLRVEALPGRPDGSTPSAASIVFFGLRTAWRLVVKPGQFDVAHGSDLAVWPLVWLAGARKRGVRRVLSAHGTDVGLATRRGLVAAAYAAYLRLGARLLRGVTVLANSRATAGLVGRFDFADVRVVRLAANVAPGEVPSAPQPYIAFVGRLTASKGCGWFIREVLPRLPGEVRLKVAGTVIDPAEREALNQPRVDYLGPVFGEDLARLRRGAIAVVAPNLTGGPETFEGFGLAATEAAAAGAVVVASRAHGIADAVIDGVTGFLEPAGEADAWIRRLEAVRDWSAAQRRAFIEGALAASAEHYSWDRVARETLAAYDSAPMPGR